MSLDKQFGAFIRKKRGEMSYAEFSKKAGLTQSSVFRLEQGQQSITLKKMQQVLERLKCTTSDVFGS